MLYHVQHMKLMCTAPFISEQTPTWIVSAFKFYHLTGASDSLIGQSKMRRHRRST